MRPETASELPDHLPRGCDLRWSVRHLLEIYTYSPNKQSSWLKINFWWRSSWSSQWAILQDTGHCRPPQTLKEKQPKAGEILAFCLWKNVPHQSRRQLMQISVLGNHTQASNMSGDEPDTKRIEKAGSFAINWLSQKPQIRSTLWVLSYTEKNTKY